MSQPHLLEISNVSKSFRGLKAISKMSLHIDQGEILGLIGPNGAGKTTLFNLVTGFIKPDTGQIKFSGQNLVGLKAHQICKLGITRTFQIVKPFAHLSTLENVAVGAFNRSNDLTAVEKKSWEILDFVGLKQKALDPASSLTLPDRKRLELARALASEPQLLLLDEVMAGLNPTEQHQIIDLIRNICKAGTTIFIIEHHMRVVMGLSDRIVVIHHGELIADDSPRAISENPSVIEAYLGKGVASA